MQLDIFHFLLLMAGLVAGAAVAWVVLKGRIALAEANGRASGNVEIATLTEQLKSTLQEAEQARERGSEAEQAAAGLRASLETATTERAQFEVRAARIPELEAALKKADDDVAAQNGQNATLREQCGKQTAEVAARQRQIEALEKATAEIAEDRATLRSKLDQNIEALRTKTEALTSQIADLRQQNGGLTTEVASGQERIKELLQAHTQLAGDGATLATNLSAEKTIVATLTQELAAERSQSQEKLALLEQAKQALSDQFKALASEILDEKSKKFTEQNQANLGQLLTPLREQITDFKTKVEEVYVNEGKDRSALTEQVKQLLTLNQTLSQDATNLTLALKGDRKAQGNWGEIILDDVLEKAGLMRGQHYERQGHVKSEDGQTHVIPDVVVRLPGDRHLVVDSKLTLPDYRAFASADSDDERAAALKRHLGSIRKHIKGLSDQNYQSLYGLKSLDFVVMFVPLEPAFMIAVTNDAELFQQAWEKNVLLVSPSTLLFVIRTVANLWRQEDLSRNAKAISDRGAELYDKLVGFVTDLNKVGERIEQAQSSYQDARKKLSEGHGNAIGQAEKLKKLGVKPSKQLPAQWVAQAIDEPLPALTNETDNKAP